MLKIKTTAILILSIILLPNMAFALQMPQSSSELADMAGISAQAYIVQNVETGQVLIEKNADAAWVPASLTKLVTALVVLDTKPKLTKQVAMAKQDQIVGGCSAGGVCIKSATGVKFTVDGLFHAMLMPSANNAASALARSTGLSAEKFAAKMNAKARALGAINSHFNEPTGMDPGNIITASDYAKIITAAFSNSYLQKIAKLNSFVLRSTNNSKYNQTIKNNDKLLANSDLTILGAKTGYLDESSYNFAALLRYRGGPKLCVVVLGEAHLYFAFNETQVLAGLAKDAQDLAFGILEFKVLGANTGQ